MKRRRLIKREHGAKSRWHSLEEYESALRLSCGFKSEAARILNVAPATITNRIDKSEHLQIVLDEVLQESLDFAEKQLHAAIADREGWAILFLLRCKGKLRGWQERHVIDLNAKVAGGVMVVPPQVSSSEEFEKIAVRTQRELEHKIDHGFNDDHGEDEEENQTEEEKFIQSSYNFEG